MSVKSKPCNHLIIFCRAPEFGTVKKRIAQKAGKNSALGIYLHLLKSLLKELSNYSGAKSICYSGKNPEFFKEHAAGFNLKKQEGADLGQKMLNALENSAKAGYEKSILVGADIMGIQLKEIEVYFDNLEKNDLVLGPAKDGGYYLIGIKKPCPEIFLEIPWGRDNVLATTLLRAREKNLRVILGPEKKDIDTLEDVLRFKELSDFIEIEKSQKPS